MAQSIKNVMLMGKSVVIYDSGVKPWSTTNIGTAASAIVKVLAALEKATESKWEAKQMTSAERLEKAADMGDKDHSEGLKLFCLMLMHPKTDIRYHSGQSLELIYFSEYKNSPRQELRVARLIVVDYDKIRQRDEVESARLCTVCVEWGCFYSNLSSRPSQPLLESMGPADEHRLEIQHRISSLSTSAVVLQYFPPLHDLPPPTSQVHFTHTDAGSISVLFASKWGLQAHPPGQEPWEYVAPGPHCAVVNVGDS
ncbi:2OG-Fe(II) oxygenase family oxidoreductase [Emericellopsis cladophorae]|uniref:2OG-Fe(II) oxygenase family oxidoreductase n=1 Tax=Emericellopsis cladophorae TaxID=2686198 RepID=A0A9P9Y099_9HYPO|nr:2OG-Fe(II) oxygenase family oxidoreductase [Emericellopsis cladophorae]KAI6781121.1 2OG-Fe(II) oxygenase family oxidoreductase [Emericellopsis cladophorae]